jgi:hypothetical protein
VPSVETGELPLMFVATTLAYIIEPQAML